MKKYFSIMLGLVIFLTFIQFTGIGWTQTDYPKRTITLICPFGAGGGTDILDRALASTLHEYLGQPVIVQNRSGSSGAIGAAYVAKARADGYTLLGATSAAIETVPLLKDFPYDPIESFTPLCRFTYSPGCLIVHNDSPWKTLDDLIKYMKSHPEKKLKFADTGFSSAGSLGATMLFDKAGVEFSMLQMKSGGKVVAALLGKHIDMSNRSIGTFFQHYKAGTIRPLCYFGTKRSSVLPEVPTAIECGYNVNTGFWRGVLAPSGVPKPAIAKLKDALEKACKSKSFTRMADRMGEPIDYLPGDELEKYIKTQIKNNTELFKKVGLIK